MSLLDYNCSHDFEKVTILMEFFGGKLKNRLFCQNMDFQPDLGIQIF